MSEVSIFDGLLTFTIVIGIFFMFYMAYKQQGILETVNEIREAFQDKVEDGIYMSGVYK